MTTYIVAGPTVEVTATSSSSGSSIAPSAANTGVGGANGPTFFKVVNTNATYPAFFKTGLTAPVAVTGVDNPIAPLTTEFIQVSDAGQAPVEIFFAAVCTNSTKVYVTPVTITS